MTSLTFLLICISPLIFFYLKYKLLGWLNLVIIIAYFVSWINVLKFKGLDNRIFNFETVIWIGSLYLSICFLIFATVKLEQKIIGVFKFNHFIIQIILALIISICVFVYITGGFKFNSFIVGFFVPIYFIVYIISLFLKYHLNN